MEQQQDQHKQHHVQTVEMDIIVQEEQQELHALLEQ